MVLPCLNEFQYWQRNLAIGEGGGSVNDNVVERDEVLCQAW